MRLILLLLSIPFVMLAGIEIGKALFTLIPQ